MAENSHFLPTPHSSSPLTFHLNAKEPAPNQGLVPAPNTSLVKNKLKINHVVGGKI